jgi:hypothetical protein
MITSILVGANTLGFIIIFVFRPVYLTYFSLGYRSTRSYGSVILAYWLAI